VELCAATSHAHIGVQVDVGAMTMAGERYDNAMAIARPYIGHVHISEPHLAEVGAGSTDHGAVAVALRHIGYGGWVSIEMRKAGLHALERAARFASDAYLGGGSVPTDEAGAPRMS
jgi:sugar phosphate isomerase/epimerase